MAVQARKQGGVRSVIIGCLAAAALVATGCSDGVELGAGEVWVTVEATSTGPADGDVPYPDARIIFVAEPEADAFWDDVSGGRVPRPRGKEGAVRLWESGSNATTEEVLVAATSAELRTGEDGSGRVGIRPGSYLTCMVYSRWENEEGTIRTPELGVCGDLLIEGPAMVRAASRGGEGGLSSIWVVEPDPEASSAPAVVSPVSVPPRPGEVR